jgi:hypothetical protein
MDQAGNEQPDLASMPRWTYDSARPSPSGAPVFVLCGARSGSTLLRFLLDAHPELACPPETNLPALAAQLATVWSLIEGAPLGAERGDEPPVIPQAAIAGVRRTMDEMTGSYLARRGKRQYCDKSLGTAQYVELLLRIYPDAKFLCLYRHPMDVIASALEACPWGLNGYGFDAYVASTPGNVVLAVARYWADNTAAILATEERFASSCHRVRYEDLVGDPEAVADGIFEFLGVPSAPGISTRCFTSERERFGPADYKIWHTSQISTQSVARGWSVPAGMIAPQLAVQMNEMADTLGYVRVDDGWGTASAPADLRVVGGLAGSATSVRTAVSPVAALLSERLMAGLSRIDSLFAQRWDACATESFTVSATSLPGEGTAESQWRVDLGTRTVTGVSNPDDDDTAWDVVGSASAWEAVLSGHTNLGVALRRCDLRYCQTSEAAPTAADTRIGMLADFLGLGSWQSARVPGRETATAATS